MAIPLAGRRGVPRPGRLGLPEWRTRIRLQRHVQLFALAVAAALPILVFSIIMILIFDREQQRSVEQMLRQTAQSAMAAVDRELAAHIGTLESLAASPQIDDGDFSGFYRHAKRVLDSEGEWLTMRLSEARTHRQILNLLTPLGEDLPSALDPDDIDRVAATRRPLIGTVRPVTGNDSEPSVTLRVPVLRGGVVLYTLSASIRAKAFSDILISYGAPEGWIATVTDRNHIIVGRNAGQAEFVGTPALLPLPEETPEGFYFTQSKEGDPLYAAFSHSRFSDWTVAIGAPARSVEGPLRRSLLVVGGGGVTALVLAMLLATILTRNLAGRQEAERRLAVVEAEQTAERRLTDIAANFPGLIYRRVLHPGGRVSYPYVSDRAEPLLGLKPGALKEPLPVDAFGHGWIVAEDLRRWRDAILASSETLDPYRLEFRVSGADGTVRWVRSMGHAHREAGGATVWDGVMLDISDLKETELALRDSDERLRLAVEATELGTWDWTPRDAGFTCSDRSKAIFGLPPLAEVTYRLFLARVHPEDRRRAHLALKRALDPAGGVGSAELNFEFRALMPSGAVRWIAARGQAMFDAEASGRRAVRFIGTVRDSTSRKLAEQALAAALAEKDSLLQQKDTLLREIHHRVKNNLQVISSLMNLEALQVEDDDARERLRIVSQRIVILGGIHEQLYRSDDFARIEIGARLREISRSLAELYRNDAVAMTIEADRLFCNIDAAIPLGLITNELVSNCFKHGFRNGRPGSLHVSLRRIATGEVALAVADDGPGMPKRSEDLRMGLGLRVVNALAKQIDAKVRFENGAGTRVTLTLAAELCED